MEQVIATDNSWHAERLTFDAAGHPIIHQHAGHPHAGGAAPAAGDHAHMPNGAPEKAASSSFKSEAWANAMEALSKTRKDSTSASSAHAPAPAPTQPQPAALAGGMYGFSPYGAYPSSSYNPAGYDQSQLYAQSFSLFQHYPSMPAPQPAAPFPRHTAPPPPPPPAPTLSYSSVTPGPASKALPAVSLPPPPPPPPPTAAPAQPPPHAYSTRPPAPHHTPASSAPASSSSSSSSQWQWATGRSAPAALPIKISSGPAPRIQINLPATVVQQSTPVTAAPPAEAEAPLPTAVHDFVARSFASCRTDAERKEMKVLLKTKVEDAKARGMINKIRWETEPIPTFVSATSAPPPPPPPPPRPQNSFTSVAPAFSKIEPPRPSPVVAETPRPSLGEIEPPRKRKAEEPSQPKKKNNKGRKARFVAEAAEEGAELSTGPLIGTSQALEKDYLRLTSAPDPATVRPEAVLRRALEHVKKLWRQNGNYKWTCDQMKSIRQDLTVQNIRNDLTIEVYETHARIALEKADRGEYNQCQSQLAALYGDSIDGNVPEFTAYRLLYFVYTESASSTNVLLNTLIDTPALMASPAVAHALQVLNAHTSRNYHRFFSLYKTVPNMGAYVMDLYIGREREAALAAMARAYRPSLSVEFVSSELAFDGLATCMAFLVDQGVALSADRRLITFK